MLGIRGDTSAHPSILRHLWSRFSVWNRRRKFYEYLICGQPRWTVPVCGGMGHIPDGVFNFIGNTIEILSAPKRTVDELSHLTNILREAKEKQRSPEEVAEKIREELPELSSFADLLPKTRAELYAFLAVIVAVIALLTQGGHGSNNTTNITVDQTINQVFLETDKAAKPKEAAKTPVKRVSPKVGRNEPCPCSSGKKYKKCCGRVQ